MQYGNTLNLHKTGLYRQTKSKCKGLNKKQMQRNEQKANVRDWTKMHSTNIRHYLLLKRKLPPDWFTDCGYKWHNKYSEASNDFHDKY